MVLTLPVLLISLDNTVLGFAVPALSEALEPTSAQLLWIVDVYSFVLSGLLITMGNLGDRIGRRRLLLIGAMGFSVALTLAAFAPSAKALIAARAWALLKNPLVSVLYSMRTFTSAVASAHQATTASKMKPKTGPKLRNAFMRKIPVVELKLAPDSRVTSRWRNCQLLASDRRLDKRPPGPKMAVRNPFNDRR